MKQIIYIAAPYTSSPKENVRKALKAADTLWERGYIPFIPHLFHQWHGLSPKPYEQWMEMGAAFLERCDAVLRLEGESPGADKEVKMAQELDMLVYFGLDDVPMIYKIDSAGN